jgi:hypothetical protein
LRQDLGNATGGSGSPSSAAPTATVPLQQPSQPVGNGGDVLGNAMSSRGFALDKITDVTLNAQVATGSQSAPPRFQTTAVASSFMTCGDKQEKGDASSAWDYVKNSFSSLWSR